MCNYVKMKKCKKKMRVYASLIDWKKKIKNHLYSTQR